MLSAEENSADVSQMIDCTATIEDVINKTSDLHAALIQNLSDDLKSQ